MRLEAALHRAHHDGRIVAAEAEGRLYGAADLLLARFIGDDIDGAVAVGFAVVDRRRNDTAGDGERERGGLDGAGRAEAGADLRFDRRHRDACGAIADPAPEAARFGRIVLRRRGAVGFDVLHFVRADAAV